MPDLKIVIDENIPFAQRIFSSLGKIEIIQGEKITSTVLQDKDILIVRSVTQVNEQLLRNSPVKFVGTATIGFDHIDTDYLKSKNIGFASAKGSNANSVVEYLFAGLFNYCAKKRIDIKSIKMGIIGVGDIGSKVADKAEMLGIHVFRNDPPLQRQKSDKKYIDLDKILSCDVITLHTPLTESGEYATKHLIDTDAFKNVNPKALLINTARGPVINNHVLLDGLKQDRIGDVILDVWEGEPLINSELLDKVYLGTPHIAGYSLEGKVQGAVMIYNEICKSFDIESKIDSDEIFPAVKKNKIECPKEGAYEKTIDKLIQQIYSIKEDHLDLKKILEFEDDEKRREWFQQLRKEYPVRREFYNYIVSLSSDHPHYERLSYDLPILGFKLVGDGSLEK